MSNLKAALPSLVTIVLLIWWSWNDRSYEFAVVIFCISILPAIFIHLEYLLEDWKKEIHFDLDEKLLQLKQGEKTRTIPFNQIISISIVESFHGEGNQLKWKILPWSFLSYTLIEIENNERVIITCLIENPRDRNWNLISNEVIFKHRWFPRF